MNYEIAQGIHTIGKVIMKGDKRFSFLAYLLHGEANVLIDTVPLRSADMLLGAVEDIIGTEPLDAIIANHSEEDHSGALAAVLAAHPGTPVFGTDACKGRLGDVVPEGTFHVVHSGDSLEIGDYQFSFLETPGLHWDDNMVTFYHNEGILFSNDLFGQRAAAEPITDAAYTEDDLLQAANAYYTAVFAAASPEEKQVVNQIAQLPLQMIAPGHGVVLQEKWPAVLDLYQKKLH